MYDEVSMADIRPPLPADSYTPDFGNNCADFIRAFQCPVTDCGKVFARNSDREHHERTVHSIQPPQYICSVCNRGFYRRDKRQEHFRRTGHRPDEYIPVVGGHNQNCGPQENPKFAFNNLQFFSQLAVLLSVDVQQLRQIIHQDSSSRLQTGIHHSRPAGARKVLLLVIGSDLFVVQSEFAKYYKYFSSKTLPYRYVYPAHQFSSTPTMNNSPATALLCFTLSTVSAADPTIQPSVAHQMKRDEHSIRHSHNIKQLVPTQNFVRVRIPSHHELHTWRCYTFKVSFEELRAVVRYGPDSPLKVAMEIVRATLERGEDIGAWIVPKIVSEVVRGARPWSR
ncbi:hypothetical protein BDD12DRAFT_805288 [Trichophaea hybrida]|nr:hypothetical protein BDD12DRAFT_805288 [Trichophaea hybrida]